MESLTMGIGVAAVAFGAYTGYLQRENPSKRGKLEPMQKAMGDGLGGIMHFFAYTIIPLVAGVCFLVAGLSGMKVN